MEQIIFFQEYFEINKYLYQLKNTLNILVALIELIRGNLMECQKKILKNITRSDSNFASTFVDYHLLPDINFNGHCLRNITFLSIKK